MLTSEDINRVVRGPADLEERIEQLEKQKDLLKFHCKKAGARIEELERDREILKQEIDRLSEYNQNLERMFKK
jgi:chromosome segregation ATPase|tara:strand:+ start:107 stop:325 length:219 start_codon:yes stop_codon:yes gene_type:complete